MKRQLLILSACALSIASNGYAGNAPTGTTVQGAFKSGEQIKTYSNQATPGQTTPGQPFENAAGSTSASGTSAPSDRFSSPDDQRLGMEVRALIIEAVGPDQSKNVYLFIDKGDVQLTGTAVSDDKKRAIVDAIKNNKNVKSVTSKLTTNAGTKKPY